VTVALERDPLIEWRGKVIALDRSRVKVKLGTEKPSPRDGSSVSLRLDSLGRESPPSLRGMVCEVGSDGVITVLPSLTTQEFNQIKAFLSGESPPAQPAPRRHKGAPPAALVPPRVEPVAPSPKAAPPKAQRTDEELIEDSITKEERERALVALMAEGRRMPMSRPELIAKVVEMRKKPNRERRSASIRK